uniref:Uncharacterized protein n=1 Tax=Ditylenchus dipsaci TaxID=166011 RepID=A0A915DN05_9BILA
MALVYKASVTDFSESCEKDNVFDIQSDNSEDTTRKRRAINNINDFVYDRQQPHWNNRNFEYSGRVCTVHVIVDHKLHEKVFKAEVYAFNNRNFSNVGGLAYIANKLDPIIIDTIKQSINKNEILVITKIKTTQNERKTHKCIGAQFRE